MKEQLSNTMQDAAAQLITKAMSGLDQATGFLSAEIPDYVHQLILWYGVKSALLATVFALFSIAWVYFGLYKPIKNIQRCIKNKEEGVFVEKCSYSDEYKRNGLEVFLIFNIFVIVPAFIALDRALTAIQIWIAPKVWLVEYASTLIK